MLTIEKFNEVPNGAIIAMGISPNSEDGTFMTNSGGELRWVAKKGYGNDWAVYCYWSHASIEYVMQHGDKVTSESNIKKCVPCTDEVFNLYRY